MSPALPGAVGDWIATVAKPRSLRTETHRRLASGERSSRGGCRFFTAGSLAALALLAGCAAAPPPADNRYCAQLFDQLDAYDFLPQAVTPAFSFRQMQIARIQQARCLTFTRSLVGLETTGDAAASHKVHAGPVLNRPVAVQVGVVTNDDDVGRAIAFFNRLGYRARSVGAPRLGTRVYVEARTLGDIERIVGLAEEAGFVGPYPSRYATF